MKYPEAEKKNYNNNNNISLTNMLQNILVFISLFAISVVLVIQFMFKS